MLCNSFYWCFLISRCEVCVVLCEEMFAELEGLKMWTAQSLIKWKCVCVCITVGGSALHLAGFQRSSSSSASQEKEMEKQRLLYQQSRLHNRGAAEMVLQMISACKGCCPAVCKDALAGLAEIRSAVANTWIFHLLSVSGEPGAMVSSTLKLGISILNGGNSDVQQVRASPKEKTSAMRSST